DAAQAHAYGERDHQRTALRQCPASELMLLIHDETSPDKPQRLSNMGASDDPMTRNRRSEHLHAGWRRLPGASTCRGLRPQTLRAACGKHRLTTRHDGTLTLFVTVCQHFFSIQSSPRCYPGIPIGDMDA